MPSDSKMSQTRAASHSSWRTWKPWMPCSPRGWPEPMVVHTIGLSIGSRDLNVPDAPSRCRASISGSISSGRSVSITSQVAPSMPYTSSCVCSGFGGMK